MEQKQWHALNLQKDQIRGPLLETASYSEVGYTVNELQIGIDFKNVVDHRYEASLNQFLFLTL